MPLIQALLDCVARYKFMYRYVCVYVTGTVMFIHLSTRDIQKVLQFDMRQK